MNIQKTEKVSVVYIVGGKEFDSKERAEAYVRGSEKVLECTFFTVLEDFDLAEGRAFQSKSVYAVDAPGSVASQALLQHLFQKNGNQALTDFYGNPTPLWRIVDTRHFEDIEEMRDWAAGQLAPHAPHENQNFNKPESEVIFLNAFGNREEALTTAVSDL